jgi:signal transduction histidine kinase
MLTKFNRYHQLWLFFLLVTLALTSGSTLKRFIYNEQSGERIQRILRHKYELLDRLVNEVRSDHATEDGRTADRNGIILLQYYRDSLVFWSGNTISSLAMDTLWDDTSTFAFISNAWYIIKHYPQKDSSLIGLLKIKDEYPYQNEFLKNGFQRDLHLPPNTQISLSMEKGDIHLKDWDGKYLFSLIFDQALKYPWMVRYIPPILYLFSLLFFLAMISGWFRQMRRGVLKNLLMLGMVALFFVVRVLQVKYVFPGSVYNLELFGPFLFATQLMPSLGDFLVNSILMIFVITRFRSDFSVQRSLFTRNKKGFYLLIALLLIMLTGYYVFTHYVFSSLIVNSSINFETFKITGITVYTFIGLLIVALHLTGILLVAESIITLAAGKMTYSILIMLFTVVYAFFIGILYKAGYPMDIISVLSFPVLFLLLCRIHKIQIPAYNYSTLLVFVFLFSMFSVYFIARNTELKENNSIKLLAENLASEHDPVAEYLLEGIDKKMQHDQRLAGYLFDIGFSTEEIFNHLKDNYFNGFWNKYSLRFTDCKPSYRIFLNTPDNTGINCYGFFDELIQERGQQLAGSNFYFIDTLNGRINYLGRIKYSNPDNHQEITLFIELESRLIAEELGYPKLLIEEKKFSKGRLLQDYSYAKYYKNRLIAQAGNFQYSLTFDYYKSKQFTDRGYDHMVFHIDHEYAIIVSKPTPTFFTRLVSFSYIFVFYYLLVVFYLFIQYVSKMGKGFEFNFKNKIQLSILSVLLLSLLLIGGGTIYFSVEQYRKKQHDILSEKIQSVYIEIDHKLAYETRLTTQWESDNYDNLGQLLLKFSDVFYTDINLYDPEGNLLATSRPDIFDRGLQGEKMNPAAFRKMDGERQAEFVHHETIGNLTYLSAYVPYLNAENKLLAYLNLPYFTRQDVFSKDISTLIIAIINVYVLLILMTIAVAVIISEQITRPLRLIRQKFSEIKLGKQYEKISYTGRDEIGNLVAEYNRMVAELARSVEMLAKSERESAWREMAKQIAHEIKNPLTPMKLSVQQLLRSWGDNRGDFDQQLERVTRTLIDQIDDLSNIASEFSNFAQMPRANNEKINLVERIRNTLDLFSHTENTEFSFFSSAGEICIVADKEQISRVFINLVKNAIQSIPENKTGRIDLRLETAGNLAVFTLTDNGKGIPDELLDKMFTPNFTTKSSGMGMGLAIVKNIIETCKGSISFHTHIKQGTTFRIEFPLCPDN